MEINLSFDSSVTLAPSGFVTAMDRAAQELDALITNPITVNIDVGYGEIQGQPLPAYTSEGGATQAALPYSTLVDELKAHATSPAAQEAAASLPANDPTNGGVFLVSTAEEKAWGLLPANGSGVDGYVGFAAMSNWNFSTAAVSGEYDFTGVALHELTHALGRVPGQNPTNHHPGYYTPLDLFRFSSPGTRELNHYTTAYFSIDGGKTNLDNFSTSSDTSDWASSAGNDAFNAYTNPGVLNTLSATDITEMNALGFAVLCFAAGTRIATPRGEILVEELIIGDAVKTVHGASKPIKWIGRSSYNGRFITNDHLMLPVCIKRNAIAENMPARDLFVSPGHAIYVDGILIPAWRLINGVTITQAASVERVSYFHIELADHDVILAEGCPAESFLDDGFRNRFHNHYEFYTLYPNDRAVSKVSHLPRVEDGFLLQAVQQRLAARAGLATEAALHGSLHGFIDQAGPDSVTGWAQSEIQPEIPVCLDIFLDGRRVMRVLANRYRADLRAAGLGSGCHGFEARRPGGFMGNVEVRRAADGAGLDLSSAATKQAA